VAVAAAGVAAVSFSMFGGGGNGAGPPPSGLAGTWSAAGMGLEASTRVSFDSSGEGGTLSVGECSGSLRRLERSVFAYTDTSGEPGCPRRLRVTVSLTGDTLRLDATRPGGRRPYVSGTLQRR
jgi:hypothetical protein